MYGATGRQPGYTVTLDGDGETLHTTNASEGRTLLYSADALGGSTHRLEITNTGGGLLLDLFVVGLQLGDEGWVTAESSARG